MVASELALRVDAMVMPSGSCLLQSGEPPHCFSVTPLGQCIVSYLPYLLHFFILFILFPIFPILFIFLIHFIFLLILSYFDHRVGAPGRCDGHAVGVLPPA